MSMACSCEAGLLRLLLWEDQFDFFLASKCMTISSQEWSNVSTDAPALCIATLRFEQVSNKVGESFLEIVGESCRVAGTVSEREPKGSNELTLRQRLTLNHGFLLARKCRPTRTAILPS